MDWVLIYLAGMPVFVAASSTYKKRIGWPWDEILYASVLWPLVVPILVIITVGFWVASILRWLGVISP